MSTSRMHSGQSPSKSIRTSQLGTSPSGSPSVPLLAVASAWVDAASETPE
eukprot:CAMPEP_0177777504 /NCGR_PEP_ID=MMETSP0491_2-20121128/15404_1 /TAXON_ID=63592 /ORGANISM="Tetraselmis chuii, Strain PLY429" /LENGTH=49 /DNA_ID=CAMNT_0019296611 /DNA_START=550 /DNA_END=699 /DNA_ORIENTATION=+